VDDNARVLVRVSPSLGSYCVLLGCHGLSSVDVAVLENNCSVTKYEVNCAVDVALLKELSLSVDVEGVLVSFDAALVEDR